MQPHDGARWRATWRVEKYATDDLSEAPYETIEGEGNLLVNAGIDKLLDLLIGAGGTTFAQANAYLGVGDSSTAAAAGQTDLQASTNKVRAACTAASRTAETVTWVATFAGGVGNFAWNEWGIFNASSSGTMLNRKVESLGTKVAGSWVLTVTATIA